MPPRPLAKVPALWRVKNLFGFTYERFVSAYARQNPQKVDSDYFSLMEIEAQALAPYVTKDVRSVLAIGAGLGGVALALSKILPLEKIVLLDKTAEEASVFYGFEQRGAFYNSLELARQLLELNGVPAEKIFCLEAPADGNITLPWAGAGAGAVDLVISTISWGFHYPISLYLESVHRLLSKDGTLIVDVRRGTGGREALGSLFSVETISEWDRGERLLARKE
jgi:hypothetical protein